MKKLLLVLLNSTFILVNAGAQLLFQDQFSYTSGQLLAPVGTPGVGQLNVAYGYNWYDAGLTSPTANQPPGIASGGLDYNNVPGYSGLQAAAGNSVSFNSTQIGTARIQVTATPITSGSLFYSGLLQVNSVSSLNSVNGALLGGFNNTIGYSATAPTAIGADLRIRMDPGNNALFDIGICVSTATTAVSWSSGLTVGTPVFVAASYQFVGTAQDVASLWVNPSQSTFGDITAPTTTLTSSGIANPLTSISTLDLRNVNTVGTTWTAQFDELKVGGTWPDVMPTNVPEPSIAVLSGLGLLALLGRSRFGRR
jgi:hypothetical protein